MTDSVHRSLIDKLYREAMQLEGTQRQSFLDEACEGNPDLRRELESLLVARKEQNGPEILAANPYATNPNEAPNLVGQTLDGRYYIEQRLSSGGIGDLYLASDKPELMSRRVVVKVLQEKALGDEWIVTKFHQEIEALTRIDDPGVVGLLDAGALPNGHPYLVMQFVDGDNLRSLMRPDRGMDFDDVASICEQIGGTLTSAHECDVVHRDLKPENIMVRRRSDGSWQVKVIDFGIAKIRNSLVAPSTFTARVAGTANYMSPEQLEGKRASAASDVYGLGVIAYEMVTGRRPFNPETIFQLSELHKAVPLRPTALRPSLPLNAEKAILQALSYRATDRYQSARCFCDDLARALLSTEDVSFVPAQPKNVVDGPAMLEPASMPTVMATTQSSSLTSENNLSNPRVAATVPSLIRPETPPFGEIHPLTTKPRTGWLRPVIIISVLLLLGLAGVAAWKFFSKPAGPERSLTYWLNVQRMYDDKPLGQPFDATGRDYFHTGDRFVLNVLPTEEGSLYLIDEGRDENGAIEWNLLFPTGQNNRGQAALVAKQAVQTGWYRFTGTTGVERIWFVWTAQPTPLLETIVRDSLNDGVIHDPAQQQQLRDFFKQHESSSTELVQDENTARAVLRGRGDVLIRRLDFSHKPNT